MNLFFSCYLAISINWYPEQFRSLALLFYPHHHHHLICLPNLSSYYQNNNKKSSSLPPRLSTSSVCFLVRRRRLPTRPARPQRPTAFAHPSAVNISLSPDLVDVCHVPVIEWGKTTTYSRYRRPSSALPYIS